MAIYIGKGNDDIFDPITMGDARAFISDSWNNTKSYVKGDYAIDDNILWKCLADNTGTKPTEGTYWTRVNVGSELESVKNEINQNSFYTNKSLSPLITETILDTIKQHGACNFCTVSNISDAPTLNAQYSVIAFGQFEDWTNKALRVTVFASTYASGIRKAYVRNVYDNNWFDDWVALN